MSERFSRLTLFPEQLYEAFPRVMKHLPGPHNKIFSNYNAILDFMMEEIESHKKDLDHNDPRDYMDSFIIEMDKVYERHHRTHLTASVSFLSKVIL